ncbi:hypothetical protein SLEP1_g53122 [Rubroshorea leprosula]|uniref:Uncharacterized protein n=1 Tax=Rubroshorea leprosula TaxID=152421 RepID=A0AAV5MB81_9ROSI|nr:hypothetical protein SLEP1_g53122 [Rubroshorea leprosula]
MLERPRIPQRLKHQNVESSKASDQKNHRVGEGRQMQERRERKGERRKIQSVSFVAYEAFTKDADVEG